MDLTHSAWWHKDEISVCVDHSQYFDCEQEVCSPVSPIAFDASLLSALAAWDSEYKGVRYHFSLQTSCRDADVVVRWGRSPEYKDPDWLGITRVNTSGNKINSAFIIMNVDEKEWCRDVNLDSGTIRKAGCYSVYDTFIHEVGHVLGLSHSDDPKSLMSPSSTTDPVEASSKTQTKEDLKVLRRFYGNSDLSQKK
jgi:predicted Zn-dependent protease